MTQPPEHPVAPRSGAMNGEPAEIRTLRSFILACVAFVFVFAECLWLRLHVATAFGRMFDDFGGRALLPAWTRAWVYGYYPYLVALGSASLLVALAALARFRGRPRMSRLVVPLGVTLVVGLPVLSFAAFYLPLFTLAQ